MKSESLVRTGRGLPDVLNTSDKIAAVLLSELNDENLSKTAIYFLFQKYFDAKFSDDSPENALIWEDASEFIALVGIAAERASPSDVAEYLKIKRELAQSRKNLYENPNQKFKALLRDVVTNKRISGNGITTYAKELSDIIRQDITSQVRMMDRSSSSLPPLEYAPPYLINAAKALLINFPILQRIEVENYQDIINAIHIDDLLPEIAHEYRQQVDNQLNARIDSIIAEKKSGQSGIRKYSSNELLFQLKIAYLISNGINEILLNPYTKHWTDADYERSVISALAEIENIAGYGFGLTKHIYDSRNRLRKKNLDMVLDTTRYEDKEYYCAQNALFSIDGDNHLAFSSQSGRLDYIRHVSDILPENIGRPGRIALKKMVQLVASEEKVEQNGWNDFFAKYKNEIDKFGPVQFALMCYTAGLEPLNSYDKDSNDEDLENENLNGADLNVESSDKKTSVKHPKIIGFAALDFYNFTEGNEKKISHPKIKSTNFDDIIHALISIYVNNTGLRELSLHSELGKDFSWSSPVSFNFSYAPEDKSAADFLLNHYPIFSQIPVYRPMDLPNGIMLSSLQEVSRDFNIDRSASITQNLLTRYFHYMDRHFGK